MIKHLTIAVLAALSFAAHACPQAAAQGRGITARVQDIGGSTVGISGFGMGTKSGLSGGVGASTSTADRNGKTCGQCQKTSNVSYGNGSNFDYGTKRGFGVSGIGIAESSDMAERSHSQSHLSTNVEATRNRNAADNFSDLRIDRAEPALPKQLAK